MRMAQQLPRITQCPQNQSAMGLTASSFSEYIHRLYATSFLSLILRPAIVNFMCTGYPDIWVNSIPGESVRMFLDESSTWIRRLLEADCPPQRGWVLSNLSRAWTEDKQKEEFAWASVSPALAPVLSPLAFLGLQLADGRSWHFLASITMWANSLHF